LEADEIVVGLGGVFAARHFDHVKTKLGLEVRGRIFFVRNHGAVLVAQFGIDHRDRAIDCDWVTEIIGCMMCQRAQGKSVFVQIARVAE
jgi:hypothetical protein